MSNKKKKKNGTIETADLSASSQAAASAQSEKKGTAKTEEGTEKRTLLQEILSWIEVFAAAILIALAVNSFLIINATVPSGSMENTIHPGDRLFGLRLTYLFTEPQRGDIVVFRYPVDAALGKKTNYIKRIVGLPGETVEVRDAKIYINGSDTPLDEPYLKEEWVIRNSDMTFEIPEGCYLMFGDNRNNSSDSRYWADVSVRAFAEAGRTITEDEARSLSFVQRKQILGKAYVRYWPLNKISLLH